MKLWIAPVIALALALPSCTAEASSSEGAGAVVKQITEALQGVTSKETAESAKTTLSDLVTKLQGLMPKAGEGMAEKVAEGAKAVGEMAKGAMEGMDFGSIKQQIERISGNAELLEPLKGVIDQLKGLIPGMAK